MKRLILVFSMILIFFSCSRTEPVIEYGFISLVYFQDRDKVKETFSFFIIPYDEEGLDNLEELYLYNDFEQLHWKLNKDDWMSFVQNEKTWIGSWNLTIEGEENMPRGQFRAVLVNKGGEKTQRYLSFDAPLESRYLFPVLKISEGVYSIDSAYPKNSLLCYDSSGKYITLAELNQPSGSISGLNLPSNVRSAALWAEDPLYFTSALTDAASLR